MMQELPPELIAYVADSSVDDETAALLSITCKANRQALRENLDRRRTRHELSVRALALLESVALVILLIEWDHWTPHKEFFRAMGVRVPVELLIGHLDDLYQSEEISEKQIDEVCAAAEKYSGFSADGHFRTYCITHHKYLFEYLKHVFVVLLPETLANWSVTSRTPVSKRNPPIRYTVESFFAERMKDSLVSQLRSGDLARTLPEFPLPTHFSR